MKVTVCPSTLTPGYETYSPNALQNLFDGKKVSHNLDLYSPQNEVKTSDTGIGRISLSGVQPKMSMILEDDCLKYSLENEQGTYIVKPIPLSYHLFSKHDCPANENLTMQIASQVYGISVAHNGLAFYKDDVPVYITRRFDVENGLKFPQEDFASLLGVTRAQGGSDYKYCNGSYEECGELIRKYVKAYMVDLQRFFRLIIFNFLSLNDDAHLKNFSLIRLNGEYRLTPAYDLINTSLHLSQSRIFALDKGLFKEGMQFSDVNTIKRADFVEFGKRIGLPDKIVHRELSYMSQSYEQVKQMIDNSFLTDENKRIYWLSYDYRRKILTF